LKYYYLRAGAGKEEVMSGSDVGGNARIRVFKNLLFHKNNENTGKNCQN